MRFTHVPCVRVISHTWMRSHVTHMNAWNPGGCGGQLHVYETHKWVMSRINETCHKGSVMSHTRMCESLKTALVCMCVSRNLWAETFEQKPLSRNLFKSLLYAHFWEKLTYFTSDFFLKLTFEPTQKSFWEDLSSSLLRGSLVRHGSSLCVSGDPRHITFSKGLSTTEFANSYCILVQMSIRRNNTIQTWAGIYISVLPPTSGDLPTFCLRSCTTTRGTTTFTIDQKAQVKQEIKISKFLDSASTKNHKLRDTNFYTLLFSTNLVIQIHRLFKPSFLGLLVSTAQSVWLLWI